MWIDPPQALAQLSRSIMDADRMAGRYDGAVVALERLAHDTSLQGQGYDAVRDRVIGYELPLVNGFRDYCDIVSACHSRYRDAVDANFSGESRLDRDVIQDDLGSCARQLYELHYIQSRIGPALMSVVHFREISDLEDMINALAAKRDKLDAFAAATAHIYSEAFDLAAALRRGVRFTGGLIWDGNSFVPTAGADDLTWRDDLRAARLAVQDDLDALARAGVYDDRLGRYGGSQMAILDCFTNDEGLRRQLTDTILSQYPGFANYDLTKTEELLQGMQQRGCSYVALANSVVEQYYFRPEQFLHDFGFPLFRIEDGERVPNFELITADIFCYFHENGAGGSSPDNYRGTIADVRRDFFPQYVEFRTNGQESVTVLSENFDPSFDYTPAIRSGTVILGSQAGISYDDVDDDTGNSPQPLGAREAHATVLTETFIDEGTGARRYIVSSWGDDHWVAEQGERLFAPSTNRTYAPSDPDAPADAYLVHDYVNIVTWDRSL